MFMFFRLEPAKSGTIGKLQTKVAQVTRNGKFTQNGISYLKAFLLPSI